MLLYVDIFNFPFDENLNNVLFPLSRIDSQDLSVNSICSDAIVCPSTFETRRTQEINTSAHGLEILGSLCVYVRECVCTHEREREGKKTGKLLIR